MSRWARMETSGLLKAGATTWAGLSSILTVPLVPSRKCPSRQPTPGPSQITAGPDGNLWFTESGTNKIGRVTPTAIPTITEFSLPVNNSNPQGITVGPDGNLWYTKTGVNTGDPG